MNMRVVLYRSLLIFTMALVAVAASAQNMQKVIVISKGSQEDLKNTVLSLGGQIHHEYKTFTAVSTSLPFAAMLKLRGMAGFRVIKDVIVDAPTPQDPDGGTSGIAKMPAAQSLSLAQLKQMGKGQPLPSDYLFNDVIIRADALINAGFDGTGVIVADIDTGTANNPLVVPALAGTVIGGESFVAGDPVPSATSTMNGPHGTWTGTMIAGHAGFLFPNADCFSQAMQFDAPGSIFDATPFGFPGFQVVPMLGVAPGASIYALKVFSSQGGGASSSTIIAAIDHVLQLKQNFLNNVPDVVTGTGTENDPFVHTSLNIQVVNMSFGGPTLIAGLDPEDLLIPALLNAGIVPAISAGNAGASGLTTGSPSSGFGSVTAAAAVTPTHDRIFRDFNFCNGGVNLSAFVMANGATPGTFFHPTNFLKTASFSSRGPTQDGRTGIGLTTNGSVNFTESADGSLALVSGTSFSAPTTTGAAALLTQKFPMASAGKIRNALILGANPNLLGDGSVRVDRGNGYLDVLQAANLLKSGEVSGTFATSAPFSSNVGTNIQKVGGIILNLGPGQTISGSASTLLASQRKEYFVRIPKNVGSITINVTSVTPSLPPAQQNVFLGDRLILYVHQAKTSSHGQGDYPVVQAFNGGPGGSVTINNPEPGFMRVTLRGATQNAGTVSTTFNMTATLKAGARINLDSTIADQQVIALPFVVTSHNKGFTFELTWKNDWTHYPTNDLDIVLMDPVGNFDFDGATLNGREVATVANPMPGTWTVFIVGATVFGPIVNNLPTSGTDNFHLQVYLVD